MRITIGSVVYDEWGVEWRVVDVDEGGKFQLRRPDVRWGSVTALCRPDEVRSSREEWEGEES